MALCKDCFFFRDLGICKNSKSKKTEVGYFQEACPEFTPPEDESSTNGESHTGHETHEEKKEEDKEDKDDTDMDTKQENQPGLTKTCTKCGKELPLESFNRSARHKDGRLSVCKECMAASRKEQYALKKAKKAGTPPPVTDDEDNRPNQEPNPPVETLTETDAAKASIFAQFSNGDIIEELHRRRITFSDNWFLEELRERGYKGNLTKTIEL